MQIKVSNIPNSVLKNLNNIIIIAMIVIWIFLVLNDPGMGLFHSDELWSYIIAKNLNFIEIIKLMHYEGHNFLYYICLKPFTHNDLLYPQIIKCVCFTFSCITVILFCFFSKINTIVKMLIIYSLPFAVVYPVSGRPYGLGILLLFLLCILYKNRLKFPIAYSILLFLSLNCHIFVTIGSSAFCIFFLYDLIKDKKNQSIKVFYSSIFIVILGFLFILLQWIPIHTPYYVKYYDKNSYFEDFLYTNYLPNYIRILYKIIFIPLLFFTLLLNVLIIKPRRWMYFILYTFTTLTLFFLLVYPLSNHAYGYFYYVYFIIGYWMLYENNSNFRQNKYSLWSMTVYLIIVSLSFSPMIRKFGNFSFTLHDYHRAINTIEHVIPENSTIYLAYAQELMLFLPKHYKVKTPIGIEIPSYRAFAGLYQDPILFPSEIKTTKGEKSYYIVYVEKVRDQRDLKFKRYDLNFQRLEIIDITQ